MRVFLKRTIKLTIYIIDFICALIFDFLFLSIFAIRAFSQIKRSHQSVDNKSILFLSSGAPIKRPEIDNKKYLNEWHQYFQKQFLSFGNKKAYVAYSFNRKQDVYLLSKGIIGINISQYPENVFLKKILHSLNFWRTYFVLEKLSKRLRISMIACYAPSDRLLLCAFLKLFLGVKLYASVMGNADLAWSEHSYNNKKIKKLILQIYEKIIAFFFFQQADLVIAYNNHIGDYALCNGASPEKIRRTRIYPCITEFDEKKVIPKNELEGFPEAKRNIIMWSRFSYEKKIPFALKGAIQALEKDSDLGLCVIGYGPMYDDIKKIIDASTVRDRISLIGFTPSFRLLSYIYHSDVALIPLGGFSMLEACLLKKPIVCFDVEWHHELLTDGYSGYFADYPNSAQIGEQILLAINNPDEAKKRGKRAYERYKLLFNTTRIAQREQQILKEAEEKLV